MQTLHRITAAVIAKLYLRCYRMFRKKRN